MTARATIALTLLFTLLSYIASVMTVPARTNLEAERIVFRFLWNGKPDRVKRQIVQLPRSKGGLGLTHVGVLATALHVKCTRVALGCDIPLTSCLAFYFHSNRLGLFMQTSVCNNVVRAGTPSLFYNGAANALFRLQQTVPDIDLFASPLKDLAEILSPSLPPHSR